MKYLTLNISGLGCTLTV